MRLSLSNALNPLLPHRCLVCEQPLRDTTLCRHCHADAEILKTSDRCFRCFSEVFNEGNPQSECAACRLLPLPLTRQRHLWSYSGKARRLIVAMKFRPSRRLTDHCAKQLVRNLPRLFDDTRSWDILVPMPSSPRNYRRRLFNPSREIGLHIARALGIPYSSRLLYHRRFTSPQATQRDVRRFANAFQSLSINSKMRGSPRVLLIDDVVTSGSTSAVAAYLLRQAGAQSVDLLALARSPNWASNRRLVSQKLNC